jgi:PAS domain S-box-containing protein
MEDKLKRIRELTNDLAKVESNLKSEYEILEFVLESSTDGYWDWNMITNYEYLSPKFKAQLGYKPEEMENNPEAWQKICNKEDLAIAYNKIVDYSDNKTKEFNQVLRLTHKKGHIVNVLCSGKIVERDADGKPLRMIGTHKIIKNKLWE